MKLDVESIRDAFPILHQEIDGKPLVYLDNAATTQKPRAVLDALCRYYENDNANVHRAAHSLSARATDAYEHARRVTQRFISAERCEEIVFVRTTTEAINLVAQSFVRPQLSAGDEIVISTMEHHSNIVPWQLLCDQTGAVLRVIPIDDEGSLRLDEYESLLSPKTKIVAITHVSNSLGTVNPIRQMIETAHAKDIPVVVDGAQGVPHMKVDVQALGCDFYAFSGHKVYGPTGIGVLYGRYDRLQAMPPYQGGGSMIRRVSFDGTTYEDPPFKFEAGTPNVAGAVGLAAALDYMDQIGIEAIGAYEHELLEYGTEQLLSIAGLRLIGTAPGKAGILSFVVDDIHADDLGKLVDKEGVAIRVGHHCTQPLMERFGLAATCRASLAFYNTRDEIDKLAAAIRKAINVINKTCPVLTADVHPEDETIDEAQDRIVRQLGQATDWEDRYRRIIELGRLHPDIPEEYKIEKLIVRGCQSTVWLHAQMADGRIIFTAASNAMIVNGLISLLLRVYSNRTPDEVLATEPTFIRDLDLAENLSQGRANGLSAMLKQIKLYAFALKSTAPAA